MPKRRQELGSVNETEVAAFLENNLQTHILAQYFGQSTQHTTPSQPIPEKTASIFPFRAEPGDSTLGDSQEKLQLLIQAVFSGAAGGISSSFRSEATFPLFPISAPTSNVLHASHDREGYQLFAFLPADRRATESGASNILWLLRYHIKEDAWEIAGLELPVTSNHACGLSFYRDATLIVLSSPSDDMGTLHFTVDHMMLNQSIATEEDRGVLQLYDYDTSIFHTFDTTAANAGLADYFLSQVTSGVFVFQVALFANSLHSS